MSKSRSAAHPKSERGLSLWHYGTSNHLWNIIGDDTRTQVQLTPNHPEFAAMCHLRIQFPAGKPMYASGWLCDNGYVLTAGHCVFSRSQQAYAVRIEVVPAQTGAGAGPLGPGFQSVSFVTTDEYRNEPDDENAYPFDYGLIDLNASTSPLPTLQFASAPDSALQDAALFTAGYPQDKPFGTLWAAAGQVTSLQPGIIGHNIDTFNYQSGSPLWVNSALGPVAVGVHILGSFEENFGVRFTQDSVQQITDWIQSGF